MTVALDKIPQKTKTKSLSAKKVYPLLRLLPYIKQYPYMVLLSIVSLLMAALATLALPLGIRCVIDQGFLGTTDGGGSGGDIDVHFQMLLGIVFILAIGSSVRFYCAYWLGERLVADLKRDVFQKLMFLSASFYDRNHSGEIMSHLAADTTLINTSIRSNVSQALRNIVVLTGALIMMIISSPSLSFKVICAIPIIVLPLAFYGKLVRRLSSKAQDVLASLNQFGSEALLNVHMVQAYGAQDHVVDGFAKSNEETVEIGLVRTKARAFLTAVAIFLVMASIVFIVWYGAHDVINGQMSAGVLVQFMLYAVFAGSSMAALSEVWGEVAQAAGATERLASFLDVRNDVTETVSPKTFDEPLSGDIVFQNVSFSYPTRQDTPVLKKISFQISPGERVAIVGPSGAGKSTLFQMILRFYDPDQGRILLDGVPIEDVLLNDLRGHFAFVPQEPALFDAPIYDNIAFSKQNATRDEVMSAARAAQADDFITGFEKGYQTHVGEGGQSLSGGQRQRIALARAILRDAPILLLDEATSALDTGSEEKVQLALDEIMENRTSLIIAHRLSTVITADRILVIDEGRVVEEGRHSDLLEKGGLYAELARTQLQRDGVEA